jgi:RNA polymerase sigma factor (sigma-70 family)
MKEFTQKSYSPVSTFSIPYDSRVFRDLAKQAAGGDGPAFQKIYDAIAGRMYSLCLRYAGNAEDADDWFQDGFMKLYRSLDSFRAEGSFEGWARQIFITSCLDGIKKRKKLIPVLWEGFDKASAEHGGDTRLIRDDLFRVIRQLPKGCQTVINLYLVEGYNHKEIGELLNISEQGSKSRLFRGRVLLSRFLTSGSAR